MPLIINPYRNVRYMAPEYAPEGDIICVGEFPATSLNA